MKQNNKDARTLFIDELMEIDGGQSLSGSSDDDDISPATTMAVGEEQE